MNQHLPQLTNGQTAMQALSSTALSPTMQAHLAKLNGAKPSDALGAGITTGFAIVSLRGKVWRIKHRGEERVILNERNEPRYSLDVIIVQASSNIAKIFYQDGYVEGSTAPPDCWSVNGRTPDPASPALQKGNTGPTCAGCWANAWGSRASQQGSKGKACADSKRIAIVPLEDPHNEIYGGPMLQRIPPASLGDLKAYADKLNQIGLPFYGVATRISFDMSAEYPKLVFEPIRVLTDDEAQVVLDMQGTPLVERILDTAIDLVETSGVDQTGTDAFAALKGQPVPTALQQPRQQANTGQVVQPPQQAVQAPQQAPQGIPVTAPAMTAPAPVEPVAPMASAPVAPSNPAPVTPQVTAALPEGWVGLPNGMFYHADHGVVAEIPQPPAPEPTVVLIALPDGNFYNPTTGEVVKAGGQSAAAPAPAATYDPSFVPQIIPAPAIQSGPMSPSGRVYGKPRDGMKKRNSQEVAEDEAYYASQGQTAPQQAQPAPSQFAPQPTQQAQPMQGEVLAPEQDMTPAAENAGLPADFANMLDGMLG